MNEAELSRRTEEFVSKLGVVEEEADERAFCLEPIIEGELLSGIVVKRLLMEAGELVAITAASRTAGRALGKSQIAKPKSPIS